MRSIAAVLALAIGSSALAQQSADATKEEYAAKLRSLRVSIDFKSAPIDEVVGYLREISGLNMIVSQKAKEKGELQISLKVSDLPLKGVLSLMLKPQGLTYVYKEGVLYITTYEDAQTDVKMEIYDVRDLLYPIRDFPGVEMSLASDALGAVVSGGDEGGTDQEMPIVDLVKAHTGGKSWDDNPKAAISMQNGLLVVKQTKEVHAQVRRLIGQLRIFK